MQENEEKKPNILWNEHFAVLFDPWESRPFQQVAKLWTRKCPQN